MIAALILATFNMLVHTRDAWSSGPWGLVLSAVVVILTIASWTMRETYQPASSEMIG
jgi:uncharacterized membrane protein